MYCSEAPFSHKFLEVVSVIELIIEAPARGVLRWVSVVVAVEISDKEIHTTEYCV